MKVLVTGVKGQLGYDVVRELKKRNISCLGADRNDFDITDEKTTKKLYDGDYLVMVTDGVLDAFGEEPGEEILKEWILQAQEQMPKELGRYLLEKTLQYADYRAKDDMTVLVAGIWRK